MGLGSVIRADGGMRGGTGEMYKMRGRGREGRMCIYGFHDYRYE